jgi:heme-degrading monooxygenase HmoA
MITVIFEVVVADGRRQEYLDIAAHIRPFLAEQEGFISIERFRSLADSDKLLSFSPWRDEEAVKNGGLMPNTARPGGRGAAAVSKTIASASPR